MFFHLLKYKLLDLLRKRDEVFWCCAFPIILGTLFYFGFGNLMNGNDIKFESFNVAVVTESENKIFEEVLSSVEKDSNLFTTVNANKEEAQNMLNSSDVKGIIYIKDTPSLAIKESSIYTTILVSFMDQYLAQADIIDNAIKNNPSELNNVIDKLSQDVTYISDKVLGRADYDPYIQYFYALIAMTCLLSAPSGLRAVSSFQADQSSLGIRRESAPTHKMLVILSDFTATVLLNTVFLAILFAYLTLVLKIDFGTRFGFIFLTGFTGELMGVSFGFFIGSIIKANITIKNSLVTAAGIFSSFLSGLMVSKIKNVIEHTSPVINRLNPATIITDCLFSLNMYDDYSRFATGIITLSIMTCLFCFGSYLALRRNTYVNI